MILLHVWTLGNFICNQAVVSHLIPNKLYNKDRRVKGYLFMLGVRQILPLTSKETF